MQPDFHAFQMSLLGVPNHESSLSKSICADTLKWRQEEKKTVICGHSLSGSPNDVILHLCLVLGEEG